MSSPFEHLTGPGKVLKAEPPDRKEFEAQCDTPARKVTSPRETPIPRQQCPETAWSQPIQYVFLL